MMGSFPWVLAIASGLLVFMLAFSVLDRMDAVQHAHGIPWMDAYAEDYCVHSHVHVVHQPAATQLQQQVFATSSMGLPLVPALQRRR